MLDQNLKEYYSMEFNMLKDAHFQTSQKIISFFQYALLIFSAPLALLTAKRFNSILLGLIFIFIGLIGILVMLYLTSLRAESLLYARQINRIRNVLYSERIIGNSIERIHRGKILLSQDNKPDYIDIGQFIFIAIVLGCFSGFYFGFGLYNILRCYFKVNNHVFLYALLSGITVLTISILLHFVICIKKENGEEYFSRIIGVDIDGVLNKHEETFVDICNRINKTTLSVSEIDKMPVHHTGRINKKQEHRVFQTKEYWDHQTLNDHVIYSLIEEIKNKYGYKVYIFTWRDWKVNRDCSGKKVMKYSLSKATKKWLYEKHIKYNRILFEKGNIDRPVSAFNSKYKTRYHYSKKYKIRFFVEDNVYNAIRLSHTCEYVFLLNHLYNQRDNIPYNIIRVDNWKEILEWIKELN